METGADKTLKSRWRRIRKGIANLYLPLFLWIWLTLFLGEFSVNFINSYARLDYKQAAERLRVTLGRKPSPTEPGKTNVIFQMGSHPENESSGAVARVEGGGPPPADLDGGEIIEEIGPQILAQYPAYALIDWIPYAFLLVIAWLWPVYRYNFSRHPVYTMEVERRVVGLPGFILLLSWFVAGLQLALRLYFHASYFGGLHVRHTAIDLVCFLMYGSIISFLNLGITVRYINRRIARPLFEGNNLYGFKTGRTITLAMRVALLIVSIAIIPMLINLYLPLSFNLYLLKGLSDETVRPNPLLINVFLPLALMIVCSVYFFIAQLTAILSFRKGIQKPLTHLIGHMRKARTGDFTCKVSVLASDEIGQLRAHFNDMLDGLAERERIRDMFGKYVSTEIASKIMQTGQMDLEGEEVELTVMFTDICDFTPLSERLSSHQVVQLLNDYFTHITRPIMAENGVINKFVGDAVMAFFSPAFGAEHHAESALRAALGVRKALESFNAVGTHEKIIQGIGVHTGRLTAGNVGSRERVEYTVIGDVVNIASRIEHHTRQAGTDILISQSMREAIRSDLFPGIRFQALDPILLKGKSTPMTLYSVVEDDL